MPNNYIEKLSKTTDMSIKELESYWEKAKEITLKKMKEEDENFWGYVTGVFKKMIGEQNKVSEESLVDLVDTFFDYVCEQGEAIFNPTTTSSDVAQPDTYLFNKPLFRVSNDMFNQIGFTARKRRGWRQKFYGCSLGKWSRENKNKPFCIQNEKGWVMDIDRDRFENQFTEVDIDEINRKYKNNK